MAQPHTHSLVYFLIAAAPALTAQTLSSTLPSASAVLLDAARKTDTPTAASSSKKAAAMTGVATSVQVTSDIPNAQAQPDDAITHLFSSDQIRTAAGAQSDIPRFLQTLPGVMFDTDTRNTYMVNGGNPLENLFIVNGVEVPNINHISTSNTSGGFVSMIDTDAVSEIKLHKMLYGSQYTGALSSVLEVKTHEADRMGLHGDVSFAYAGADVVLERSFGQRMSTTTEFRKSVVNYFTDDIGIDGVPKYSSILSTTTSSPTPNDTITTLYLAGDDKLDINPNKYDWSDPNLVSTHYTGNRMTMAGTWTHTINDRRQQVVQFNFSQARSTTQQSTLQTNVITQTSTVYSDNLLDRPITFKYDYFADEHRFSLRSGIKTQMHGLGYQMLLPNGYPSPYSTNPTPIDPLNVNTNLHPFDAGAYTNLTLHGPRGMQVNTGVRFQRFGIDGANTLSPMFSVQSPSVKGFFLYGGVAKYSQLAPMPLMLGVASNQNLRPISDTQLQVGIEKITKSEDRFNVSAYRKLYNDYPVSTQFPSLSLANIVDPFSQPSFPLPMTSAGKVQASGIEAEFASSVHRKAFIQANVALQSVKDQALDGISRRSNFDMPVMANIMSGMRIGQKNIVTARYSYHTGTPYTPFLFDLSTAQDRPIYDLSQINTQRGSYYGRMDLHYELEQRMFKHNFRLTLGLDNVLGRNNYYQLVFLPSCSYQHAVCAPYQLTQEGRIPEGGLTYIF